jgi:hypothetical protein
MKIHGNFQNLEMYGSTNGDILVGVQHRKHGVLGRKVSIGACLSVWKHRMNCNHENWFDNFIYLP